MTRLLLLLGFVVQAAPARGAAPPAPAVPAALREADAAFLKAYNAGDAGAVAALYAEDGELVDEAGATVRGRAALRALYEEVFADRPGWTMTLALDSVRLIGPGTAVETGRTVLTPSDGSGPLHQQFSAVLVERDGRWLQAYVRELPELVIDPKHRLLDLQWLLGEWVDESPEAVVVSSGAWSPDRRYILREFTTHVRGKAEMTVTQRIGWDPTSRQIKSWVFDSEGGHSEALWARAGDRWVAKATGVLADGRTATATHVYTVVGKRKVRYQSIDRTAGDEALDDGPVHTLVPRPPAPKR